MDCSNKKRVLISMYVFLSFKPRRSVDHTDLSDDKVNTAEQTFLIGLHKFMHDSNMPIGRIPSLGFKQSKLECEMLFLL